MRRAVPLKCPVDESECFRGDCSLAHCQTEIAQKEEAETNRLQVERELERARTAYLESSVPFDESQVRKLIEAGKPWFRIEKR
jgi:hypothetical protein